VEWGIASEVGIIMDCIIFICELKNMEFTLSRIFIKIWLSTLKKEEVCPSKTFV
jgi:predicted branched-subunit amino acid permease